MRTEIIYEDERLLIVYKPAGLATESARVSQADVVSELKNYLSHGTKIPYLGLAHRLDQPVEGLLAVAKDQRAAAELARQLQNGRMKKRYLAAVYVPAGMNCELNEPVELHDFLMKEGGRAGIVPESAASLRGAQKAVLTYSIQKVQGNAALARVDLETGRFHQIRCQLAAHGLPLLGDVKYGNEESLALGRELKANFVALCADTLTLLHPDTGKELRVTVEPRNEVFRVFDVQK